VMVTHDARVAATADRVITMSDGRFVQESRPRGGADALSAFSGSEV